MSKLTSQDYAELANDSYSDDYRLGPADPSQEERTPSGNYKILEHASNPDNGYQGTIYQRLSDGEIVVAHRGTEQIWKDAVIADGSMVTRRTNPQAEDAIALTRRALEYSKTIGERPGMEAPQVTVTGHSLGGTLAQVSAHHFDLRGETFNAYGAASLDLKIPPGPNGKVLNHVMANDAVSAASPQYGDVRIYATEKEMSVLNQSGYFNNRFVDAITPDLAVVAAGRSMGSHSMHNFLPLDGKGKPDVSVLQDPAALQRATDNAPMIENYRGDVQSLRRAVTIGARGPVGWVRDGVDYFSDRDPAGAPAAREELLREGRNNQFQDAPGKGNEDKAAMLDARGVAADPQQAHVARLLEAARSGSPDGMRAATEALQASQAGQQWQARADQHAQELTQREAAAQQGARLHEVQQQDMARYG